MATNNKQQTTNKRSIKTLCSQSFGGFTLAEVLITLGIIGVVAAISIPALINNTQRQESVVAYKRMYNILTQAFTSYAADNESYANMANIGSFDESASSIQAVSTNIATMLQTKLKTAKDCGWNGSGCFASSYKYLNSSGTSTVTGSHTFVAIDGTAVSVLDLAGNCNFLNPYNLCATIRIDSNGAKGPNQFGRDTWLLYLKSNGTLVPHGSPDSWKTNDTDTTNNCRTDYDSQGKGCSGRVFDEGWQMNY